MFNNLKLKIMEKIILNLSIKEIERLGIILNFGMSHISSKEKDYIDVYLKVCNQLNRNNRMGWDD